MINSSVSHPWFYCLEEQCGMEWIRLDKTREIHGGISHQLVSVTPLRKCNDPCLYEPGAQRVSTCRGSGRGSGLNQTVRETWRGTR